MTDCERKKPKEDIVDFFRNSPLFGLDLDIIRDEQYEREVDFGSCEERESKLKK